MIFHGYVVNGLTTTDVERKLNSDHLEAQEPDSEIADDIRSRLEELAGLRARKKRAPEAAEKETAQVPDPESAEALVAALPLLDVDWELVSIRTSAICSPP